MFSTTTREATDVAHYECSRCGKVEHTVRGLCSGCHGTSVMTAARALELAEAHAGARFDFKQRAARRSYIAEHTKKQRAALAAAKRADHKED